MADRLCGDGPPLQFLFDIDEEYKCTMGLSFQEKVIE